jgi:uncharacterized protein involved in exopolysaccharide biosynthesis
MESEIDLRPYILAVLHRWRLIVLFGMVLGLVALLVTLLQPPTYTATADVLIFPVRSQLEFDPRFTTSDAPDDVSTLAWQQALSRLAESGVLEERVRSDLPSNLVDQDSADQPGSLVGRIRVSTEGNLLHLQATAADGQEAKILVDTWAQAYVSLVNELYGSDTGLSQEVEEQLVTAQERYENAQQELETFIGTSQLVPIEEQIDVIESLLEGSREANQALYTEYLSRTHALELVLRDAQTLREQTEAGASDDLANSLALLALRARTVGNVQLPVELRFDDPGTLTQATGSTVDDLSALISVLQQRQQELAAESQQLAQTIAGGAGTTAALTAEQRSAYEEQLAALQQQKEQQVARQNFLRQRRDLAFESLTILQRKLDEQRIAQGTSQVEVRLIGSVIEPLPSIVSRLILNSAIAMFVGVFLGVLLVIGMEIIRPLLTSPRPQPSQERERPVDQPVAG